MSRICQGYSRHIFSESLGNMSGIFPTYDFVCETPGPAPCACCNAMIGPWPVCIQFSGVMGIQCHGSARAAPARTERDVERDVVIVGGSTSVVGGATCAIADSHFLQAQRHSSRAGRLRRVDVPKFWT